MSHARTTIRDAVATACEGITGFSAANVLKGRLHEVHTLPAITVYTLAEESQPSSMGNRILDRTLSLIVEGYEDGTDVDAEMDTLAASIESAVGGEVGGCYLAFVQSTDKELSDGDKRYGVVRVTFEVHYRSSQDSPAVIV